MSGYIRDIMKRYNHLIGEINAVYHELSLKLGLSDSAMSILYTIYSEGDSYMLQDICRLSGLSKQTVNSALRKLEAEEIVYLQASGAKEKKVCLTKSGKELAARTAGRILEAENEIFASWPQEDVHKYMELTELFLNDLKERAKGL